MNIDPFRFTAKPAWLRVGLGLSFVVSAVLISNLIWLVVDRPISSPIFLAVIVLSAWLCGFRVGAFCAVSCGIAMKYFFTLPYHQLIGDRQVMVRITVFIIEGILLSWLIERLRFASERIQESREELRALNEQQRTVREDEQKRIAREIHDELGQVLTGLKMDIHFLNRRVASADSPSSRLEISNNLTDLSTAIDGTISSVRRIASELRPSILDDFGLIAAIEWQAQEFERNTKIPCSFKSDTDSIDLGPESNTSVFRIFQETLTNVARHANAKNVFVNFEKTNREIVMTVRDDGSGVDPESIRKKRSLGILGMQERSRLIGAELDIGAAAGGGTSVALRVPASVNREPALN